MAVFDYLKKLEFEKKFGYFVKNVELFFKEINFVYACIFVLVALAAVTIFFVCSAPIKKEQNFSGRIIAVYFFSTILLFLLGLVKWFLNNKTKAVFVESLIISLGVFFALIALYAVFYGTARLFSFNRELSENYNFDKPSAALNIQSGDNSEYNFDEKNVKKIKTKKLIKVKNNDEEINRNFILGEINKLKKSSDGNAMLKKLDELEYLISSTKYGDENLSLKLSDEFSRFCKIAAENYAAK